jgi:Ca2+-transporting ATPase
MATGHNLPEASAATGLTAHEAAARLAARGANELPAGPKRTLVRIVLSVAAEPMFIMLVGAGVLYLLLGSLGEALLLLGFVGVVMGITIMQERKTERVLGALRDLSSPRARVVRDAVAKLVAGREVVPGDILLLEEGDRVAADALLLEAHDLSVDESLLTGESVPVGKRAVDPADAAERIRPGGENTAVVYAGSMVVQGSGTARVHATGADTEMGRIGLALAKIEEPPSPLQRETATLVRRLAIIASGISIAAAALYWATRGGLIEAILAGLALAMSVLPEEFPVILTVFMAMGAPSRAHAAHRRHRDARSGHRAVRRQDRHAHRKPDDGAAARHGRWRTRSAGGSRAHLGGAHAARDRRARERREAVRPDGAGAASTFDFGLSRRAFGGTHVRS